MVLSSTALVVRDRRGVSGVTADDMVTVLCGTTLGGLSIVFWRDLGG